MDKLQATRNEILVIGTLKDKKLEVKTSTKGNQYITGNLTVNVVDKNGVGEIKIRVMQMATKADGTENKLYKGAVTVKNDYKIGDTIKVMGSVETNDFYLANEDKVVESIVAKASIITRVDETTEHCAKVCFGGYIESINDLEDGSAKVKMIGANFKGDVIPVTLDVPQELVQAFKTKYYDGCTTTLYYHMVNAVMTIEDNTVAEFGESFGSTVTRKIKKNLVFGGDKIEELGMDGEVLRKAMALRQMELEKKLQEGRERKTQPVQSAPSMNNGFEGFKVDNAPSIPNPFASQNSPF